MRKMKWKSIYVCLFANTNNVKKATNKIRITVYFAYPILRPMLIFMISLIDIVNFINGTK